MKVFLQTCCLQESSVYQHVHGERVNYDVAWDSAVHEKSVNSLPPPRMNTSSVQNIEELCSEVINVCTCDIFKMYCFVR